MFYNTYVCVELSQELSGVQRLLICSAHPDDESTSFGGLLALAASRGVETMVLTTTDGALGDSLAGYNPCDARHDCDHVVRTRQLEIMQACILLGVNYHMFLDYRDSGIAGWERFATSRTFAHQSPEQVITAMVQVVEWFKPTIVVTHDATARHQHQDHQLSGTYMAAALQRCRTSYTPRLYYKLHGKRHWDTLCAALKLIGIERTSPLSPQEASMQREVVQIDASGVINLKYAALHAHTSQLQSSSVAQLPRKLFAHVMHKEEYFAVSV